MATYEHEMQIRELRERVKELEGGASMAKVPDIRETLEFAMAQMSKKYYGDAKLTLCGLLSTLPKDEPSNHWKLGMRVMQSELYRLLDCEERAICDELIAQNPYMAKRHKDDTQAAPSIDSLFDGSNAHLLDGNTQATCPKCNDKGSVAWVGDRSAGAFICDCVAGQRLTMTQNSAPQADIGVDGQAVTGLSHHGHAMLLNVLWHHQGGNSPVGQTLRSMLGIGRFDHLTETQIEQAKWVEQLLASPQATPSIPAAYCNKCGYFGPPTMFHSRPGTTEQCPYSAVQQQGEQQ